MDDLHVGECKPEGYIDECAFFLCPTTEKHSIISKTGTIDVEIEFKDHLWKCSCDISSWYCSRNAAKPTQLPMVAVARIKLERQISSNNSGNIF